MVFVMFERGKMLCRRDKYKVRQDALIYLLATQKIFVEWLLCGRYCSSYPGQCCE